MKRYFLIQIIIVVVLSLIAPTVVFATLTAQQEQYKIYQSAHSKFNSSQTESQANLIVSAVSLMIEYQKLIKEEVKDSIYLKEEDKNSFSGLLDANILTMERIAETLNQNGDTAYLTKIKDELDSIWQIIRANIKQIRGIILIRKSEQVIEKINLNLVKLQEQIKPGDRNYELMLSEIDVAKKNIETASRIKDELQIMFNAIIRDPANANTLYNEGKTKLRDIHLAIRQSIALLEKASINYY